MVVIRDAEEYRIWKNYEDEGDLKPGVKHDGVCDQVHSVVSEDITEALRCFERRGGKNPTW